MPKSAIITGVGGGTGAALVRRFAAAGYKVAMLARNADFLSQMEHEVHGSQGHVCDVGDRTQLAAAIERIRNRQGVPSIVVHNAVSARFGRFGEISLDSFESNFRVNAVSLLQLAQLLVEPMIDAGGGALVVTGNTAAFRGVPTYTGFAPTKAAQRILAQALAKDLGPRGLHVAYVTIDAAIAAPWLAAEPTANRPPLTEDRFAQPEAIADEVFHIAHQHRSTWSFDHVIRPYTEGWTLN